MPEKIRIILLLGMLLCSPRSGFAQSRSADWESVKSGKNASFRGVCAVSAQVCWVSGSKGTVLRTTDSGKSWEDVGPSNCEELDFRDVEAWDEHTALIMSSGEEDRIYRTEDGGRTWSLVYEHPNRGAFFDGIAFANNRTGWLMGDPLNGQLLLLRTLDGGKSWAELPADRLPKIQSGEAGFAASGTNLVAFSADGLAIALGGSGPGEEYEYSRIVLTKDGGLSWSAQTVPMGRSEAGGIFSLCLLDAGNWVAVGGNYKQPEETKHTAAFTQDGGVSWTAASKSLPSGYRSCVAHGLDAAAQPLLIAVGPSGTDISRDRGQSWQRCSETGFHALDFSPDRKAGWAAGADGRIARWPEK